MGKAIAVKREREGENISLSLIKLGIGL